MACRPLCLLLLCLVLCSAASAKLLRFDSQRAKERIEQERARELLRIKGPCTLQATAKTIYVRTEKDIWQRMVYGPTQTVNLVLMNSITLSQGMVLNGSFSCTFFTANALGTPTLSLNPAVNDPVLTVLGAGNMLFIGINLKSAVTAASPACTAPYYFYGKAGKTSTCPALYIVSSYNIQYTKAAIYGRVEMARTVNSVLDGLKATMAPYSTAAGCQPTNPNISIYCNTGVIRVTECGVPSKMIGSGNVISNNEVYDSWELISLLRGAVGVTVKNNNLHGYNFTAIRCGDLISMIFDCMMNSFSNNYIYVKPWTPLTGDSSGIYTNTHWFNPGNVFTCNYVIGGDHCYYFDLASSGVRVDGGVCVNQTDGVKFNNGKYNVVRNLLMVGVYKAVSYVTCFFANDDINCYQTAGQKWEAGRRLYYDTPAINARWPYLKSICNPVNKSINGVPCNNYKLDAFTAHATGWCSGLGYLNDEEVIMIDADLDSVPRWFCPSVVSIPLINRQAYFNVSTAAAQFLSPNDYGVRRTSWIYRSVRTFRSCPRSTVGPQPVLVSAYYWNWNRPKPTTYDLVQLLNIKEIIINYNYTIPNIYPPRAP